MNTDDSRDDHHSGTVTTTNNNNSKGAAVVATVERSLDEAEATENDHDEEATSLIKVPSDMILSLEGVMDYAKSDRYLKEVLEVVGDFGRVC